MSMSLSQDGVSAERKFTAKKRKIPETELVKNINTTPMYILKRLSITLICLTLAAVSMAQEPFIQVIHPYKPVVSTSTSRNYLSGNTCKHCTLSVNGKKIKVYPTGAFAIRLDLKPGDTTLTFKSVAGNGQVKSKSVTYHYQVPQPVRPVSDFRIASVETFPTGDCWLMPGDIIRFRVKAQPGNKVTLDNKIILYEQPASGTGGMPGIYQCSYMLRPDDPLLQKAFVITMEDGRGKSLSYSLSPKFKLLPPGEPLVGKTTGAIPYLEFGQGSDRLGGAKISYLDTAVLLQITGKFGGDYRVQLAPDHTAYIPVGQVLLMSKGAFPPHSLTGSWRVSGDAKYDYVSIGLDEKLPYTTFQQIDPSRIVLDIYGATSNTNWITQLTSAKEVKNVWYEQPEDGVVRVTIELKHHQQWGYLVYYDGNALTVRVKRQPQKLSLPRLTIAIDPGHGGSNRGAQGPTGTFEKEVTLQIAKRLRKLLENAGATVIMTRTTDESKDMIQRTHLLRMADPDLLVSVHLNSSGNPIDVSGTSTYYRYIGFRPLSQDILKHMCALGLEEYGNVGRFNFALNGPTDYPNALVETVFISNPEDEMKALNPAFQQKIAGAIMAGINDFLKQAATPVK
jgi:N-acetylmuramoyl-L-alanine amidase